LKVDSLRALTSPWFVQGDVFELFYIFFKKLLKYCFPYVIIYHHAMMKSANLQNDITESVGKAETDVYPAEDAFPFGAYRMNYE